MQSLYEKVKNFIELTELPEVPKIIRENIREDYGEREYQKRAFGYFELYFNNKKLRQNPSQLLFHMATGSGKTLIMAGLILRLYDLGYRNFIFFVNSSTIINKTRENFFNPSSSKYLFAEKIFHGEKEILIREVQNFEGSNDDDIQIHFTTIQGLHSTLNTPRENAVTYTDFEDKKIVLISDEAHHINAETKKGKKLSKGEVESVLSWEGTVNKIFRSNAENILLEFTATTDFTDENIADKYFDKHLFDYPLKEFRKDGYSKEVKVLQADISDNAKRALQAIVLSQYRRKVFEKNRKRIKPVILFKSKTIGESEKFFEKFTDTIKNLTGNDLIEASKSNSEIIKRAFKYFEDNGITLDNLAQEIRTDFSEDKCIVVNSKNESEEKQIAVNSLEDENNEYRAVFAVDKLNEGWDVLNLFDIVRLYNTRDGKAGKIGKTTMSEAQLIGRGARYCPFQIDEKQERYKRKYDDDIDNELRIGEELYYHSFHNPKYIQELNKALHEIGIKAKESKEIYLNIKEEFKETDFYKKGVIFINERKKYDGADITGFNSTLITTKQKYTLSTGYAKAFNVFAESVTLKGFEKSEKDYQLSDFGRNVLLKALNKLDFYSFNNLKTHLPNLQSYSEFITSENYLGKIKVAVEGRKEEIENLSPQQKLEVAINVLDNISNVLEGTKVNYKGTTEFTPHPIYKTFKDKILNIAVNEESDQEFGIGQSDTTNNDLRLDLSERDWYVFNDNFGTSEEKALVRYINKVYDQLESKYEKVYLVRNEKHFQLFNFDDGRPLEPDFVLFLIQKDEPKTLYYQIFIEPKGGQFTDSNNEFEDGKEGWKQKFLLRLKEEGKTKVIWENKDYSIIGMPFYNSTIPEREKDFEDSMGSYL